MFFLAVNCCQFVLLQFLHSSRKGLLLLLPPLHTSISICGHGMDRRSRVSTDMTLRFRVVKIYVANKLTRVCSKTFAQRKKEGESERKDGKKEFKCNLDLDIRDRELWDHQKNDFFTGAVASATTFRGQILQFQVVKILQGHKTVSSWWGGCERQKERNGGQGKGTKSFKILFITRLLTTIASVSVSLQLPIFSVWTSSTCSPMTTWDSSLDFNVEWHMSNITRRAVHAWPGMAQPRRCTHVNRMSIQSRAWGFTGKVTAWSKLLMRGKHAHCFMFKNSKIVARERFAKISTFSILNCIRPTCWICGCVRVLGACRQEQWRHREVLTSGDELWKHFIFWFRAWAFPPISLSLYYTIREPTLLTNSIKV